MPHPWRAEHEYMEYGSEDFVHSSLFSRENFTPAKARSATTGKEGGARPSRRVKKFLRVKSVSFCFLHYPYLTCRVLLPGIHHLLLLGIKGRSPPFPYWVRWPGCVCCQPLRHAPEPLQICPYMLHKAPLGERLSR